jgi:hypothetical protein
MRQCLKTGLWVEDASEPSPDHHPAPILVLLLPRLNTAGETSVSLQVKVQSPASPSLPYTT